CLACHNRDPAKNGPTGPPIKGSSEALLQARILHKRYPPGYVPKRKSNAMPAYTHLKKVIPDLAAFLR
ncbi:MAG: cytochrome C, partial [Candidatus Binatia bacterium]